MIEHQIEKAKLLLIESLTDINLAKKLAEENESLQEGDTVLVRSRKGKKHTFEKVTLTSAVITTQHKLNRILTSFRSVTYITQIRGIIYSVEAQTRNVVKLSM